jgi:hypothetical protein
MSASDYSLNTNFSWKDIPSTSWGTAPTYSGATTFRDIFEGATGPSFDWSRMSTPSDSWGSQSTSTTQRDPQQFKDFAKVAVDLANQWRGATSSSPRSVTTGPNVPAMKGATTSPLPAGGTITMRDPIVRQKTSSGGGGGFADALGPVGSIVGAGIGLALAPATGGLSAALPFISAGSSLGGAAGSVGRSLFG